MDVPNARNEANEDKHSLQYRNNEKECKSSRSGGGVVADFVSNTTLHGLRYLSESISVIEKLFWLITFIASIGLCSCLIRDMWHKWQHNPIIVSFNEELIPVWKVPFPAVTICPQMKCKKKVYNYSHEIYGYVKSTVSNDTDYNADVDMLDDVSTVCGGLSYNFPRTTKNSSLIEHVRQVAPGTDDIFLKCYWRHTYPDCSLLFKEVLTQEGVCFTFNTLSEKDMFNEKGIQKEYKYIYTDDSSEGWSMAGGYMAGEVKDVYPRMGKLNGDRADLAVDFIEYTEDRDALCNGFRFGFKVYLHHPADMPQSSLYYYSVTSDQATALAVKFDMISTSNNLQDYSSERRQCHFPGDRKLKYFRHYTQSNCELECVSNYTYSKCGCVWLHMPHSDSRHICSSSIIKCVNKAKFELLIKMSADNLTEACDCLPSCNSVAYDAEIHKVDLDDNTYVGFFSDIVNSNTSMGKHRYSTLEVYFKQARFVSRRRSELFGTTAFLANCGGLLGLFLGFSFLSLVEILYFLTLRVCCSLWRNKVSSKNEDTPHLQ